MSRFAGTAAASFVLGLGLLGPTQVAFAETPKTDTTEPGPSSPGPRERPTKRTPSAPGTARPAPVAAVPADAAAPQTSAGVDHRNKGAVRNGLRSASPAATASRTGSSVAKDGFSAFEDGLPASRGAAAEPIEPPRVVTSAAPAVPPSPDTTSAAIAADRRAAAAAASTLPGPTAAVAAPKWKPALIARPPAQAIQSVRSSIAGFLDRLGAPISGLPATAFTEALSKTLWLFRRAVLPVGSGVGMWGSASCVTAKDCSGQDLTGVDLTRRDLDGVDFSSANLTRAILTGASLVRGDLTKANLTQTNFTGAVIAYTPTAGAIWSDTTCRDGSKSSTGCGGSPGLIASDWLRVDEETGEFNGDEPVLVSMVLQTTLGKAGSTSVRIVPESPHELDQGVDVGDTVRIPDATGDLWTSSVQPLNYLDLQDAALNGTALRIPLIVTATLALEGDWSSGAGSRLQMDLIANHLRANVVKELEGTAIYIGGPVQTVKVTNPGTGYTSPPTVTLTGGHSPLGGKDAVLTASLACEGCGVSGITVVGGGTGYTSPPKIEISGGGGSGALAEVVLAGSADTAAALTSALNRIASAAVPSMDTLVDLLYSRIEQWFKAGTDPDDPIGVSVTALIPVDDSVVNALEIATEDKGGFAKLAGLDDQYLKLVTKDVGFGPYTIDLPYLPDLTVGLRTFAHARYGLLVPPESLKKNEGKAPQDIRPQYWETTYNGLWTDNDWARYVVGTQAWPQVTWRP